MRADDEYGWVIGWLLLALTYVVVNDQARHLGPAKDLVNGSLVLVFAYLLLTNTEKLAPLVAAAVARMQRPPTQGRGGLKPV